MPTPQNQAHGKAFFREISAAEKMPTAAPVFLVTDGTDRTFSTERPETAAFVNDGSGTYVLTDFPLDPGADRLDAVMVAGTVQVY